MKTKSNDVCKVPSTMHTLHIIGTWYTFVFFNLPTEFWGYLLFFYPLPPWVCHVSSFSHLSFVAFLPDSNSVQCVRGKKSSHIICRTPLDVLIKLKDESSVTMLRITRLVFPIWSWRSHELIRVIKSCIGRAKMKHRGHLDHFIEKELCLRGHVLCKASWQSSGSSGTRDMTFLLL